MGNYALTQRNKLQFGLVQPGVTPTGDPVPVPYTFPNVTPAWPVDTKTYEETHDWDGTFEAVHELNLATAMGEQTLVWERLTFADAVVLGQIALAGGVAGSLVSGTAYGYDFDSDSVSDLATVYTEMRSPYASAEFTKTLQAGVCRTLVIEGSPAAPFLKATATIRGNLPVKINAMTTAVATGHSTTRIRHSAVELYMGESANPSTQVECSRLAFKLTIDNGIDTVFTDCGPTHGRGGRKITLQLDLLLDAVAASEWAHFDDNDKRYITLITQPDADDNAWALDLCAQVNAFNHGTQGKFEKVTLLAVGRYDSTIGTTLRKSVQVDGLTALGCLIT